MPRTLHRAKPPLLIRHMAKRIAQRFHPEPIIAAACKAAGMIVAHAQVDHRDLPCAERIIRFGCEVPFASINSRIGNRHVVHLLALDRLRRVAKCGPRSSCADRNRLDGADAAVVFPETNHHHYCADPSAHSSAPTAPTATTPTTTTTAHKPTTLPLLKPCLCAVVTIGASRGRTGNCGVAQTYVRGFALGLW